MCDCLSFIQPVGVFIRRAPVCRWDTTATEIATIEQYQAFLALDVPIQLVVPIMSPRQRHSSTAQPPSSSSSSSTTASSSLSAVYPASSAASSAATNAISASQISEPSSAPSFGTNTSSSILSRPQHASATGGHTAAPLFSSVGQHETADESTPTRLTSTVPPLPSSSGVAFCPPCPGVCECVPRTPRRAARPRHRAVEVAQEAFALSAGFFATQASLLATDNVSVSLPSTVCYVHQCSVSRIGS